MASSLSFSFLGWDEVNSCMMTTMCAVHAYDEVSYDSPWKVTYARPTCSDMTERRRDFGSIELDRNVAMLLAQ